jgi:fimbrial chaperone protein
VRWNVAACILWIALPAISPAPAATLSVSPVSFDIEAPRTNSKLTLQNRGEERITVQIRVFRWEKKDGADHLIPTKDVVASPPVAKLKPDGKHTVRVVRVTHNPVVGEESYRLLVDQLPKPAKGPGTRVSFLLRQSIPVFFTTGEQANAQLKWSASIKRGELVLAATNVGTRRARVSQIQVRSPTGAFQSTDSWLSGYVLAGSVNKWRQPLPKGIAHGSKVTITARNEHGEIEASAIVGAAE